MPAPDILRAYDEIVPGAAERIIRMAEADSTERARVDRELAQAEIDRTRTGQAIAFLLVIVAMTLASIFFFQHNNAGGGAFLSVPVLVLIGTFLNRPGRKDDK
jgi:uncharacterized membrane protein